MSPYLLQNAPQESRDARDDLVYHHAAVESFIHREHISSSSLLQIRIHVAMKVPQLLLVICEDDYCDE